MTELIWIRSHVELLLQREWDVCRLLVDPEGDFPYRRGTAACWVSVLATEPVMVRVVAQAAHDIRPTLAVLREINAVQAGCLSVRITHTGTAVMVSQTISPIGLTQPVLAQAVDAVASVAADVGPLFAAMFGGHTPFPATQPTDEEVS